MLSRKRLNQKIFIKCIKNFKIKSQLSNNNNNNNKINKIKRPFNKQLIIKLGALPHQLSQETFSKTIKDSTIFHVIFNLFTFQSIFRTSISVQLSKNITVFAITLKEKIYPKLFMTSYNLANLRISKLFRIFQAMPTSKIILINQKFQAWQFLLNKKKSLKFKFKKSLNNSNFHKRLNLRRNNSKRSDKLK